MDWIKQDSRGQFEHTEANYQRMSFKSLYNNEGDRIASCLSNVLPFPTDNPQEDSSLVGTRSIC